MGFAHGWCSALVSFLLGLPPRPPPALGQVGVLQESLGRVQVQTEASGLEEGVWEGGEQHWGDAGRPEHRGPGAGAGLVRGWCGAGLGPYL